MSQISYQIDPILVLCCASKAAGQIQTPKGPWAKSYIGIRTPGEGGGEITVGEKQKRRVWAPTLSCRTNSG